MYGNPYQLLTFKVPRLYLLNEGSLADRCLILVSHVNLSWSLRLWWCTTKTNVLSLCPHATHLKRSTRSDTGSFSASARALHEAGERHAPGSASNAVTQM